MSKTEPNRRAEASRTDAASCYASAQEASSKGQIQRAIGGLRRLLKHQPEDPRAHFLLGNLYRKSGQHRQALQSYENALALKPENLPARLNRANTLMRLERLREAETAYSDVLNEWPNLAIALLNYGLLLARRQKSEEAIIALQQAAKADPDLAEAHRSLADLLKRHGRFEEALNALNRLLRLNPRNIALLQEIGDLFKQIGEYGRAEHAYRSALRVRPSDAELHYSLGSVLQFQCKYESAIEAYEKALELEPGRSEIHASLGNCLHQIGDNEAAIERYTAALEINPGLAHARFAHCISQLPVVYGSEEEIERCRAGYSEALTKLHDHYRQADQAERAKAAKAVGFLQPFYLAYQGLPVKDLQRLYGATIQMLMAALFPEFNEPPVMPAVSGKVRLGIVSGFFKNHSAWNHFQGIYEALDRNKLEIILFSTRSEPDRETALVRSLSDGFIDGPMSTEDWAKTIRRHNLHALLYPEFGMDPVGIQLGCLRLAPIQLTSWGHPITSGLDTIDYFLSSDLMEPDNGQDEYTERLVRLPNLGMHYRLPVVDPAPLTREDLGLPGNGVMYWCCQSLYKYLPRHDDIYPLIADELESAFFVFLEGHGGKVKAQVARRLERAFGKAGLPWEKHCYFLPRLPKPEFAAATAMADVFLDSVDWSGCNSSMEAIAAGVPLVTLPGSFMRGRHTLAFLKRMGLTEWVAESKTDLVQKAVMLGADESLRRSVSRKIRRRRHLLYRDPEPVRALETLLEESVSARQTQASASARRGGIFHHLSRQADETPADPVPHWNLALHFQSAGDLAAAAESFGRSLTLSNELYASAAREPASPPIGRTVETTDEIEINGLRYPKIPPLDETESRPFWTVVIPAYNRDRYLLECIASVLSQWSGEDDMEIVVVDNGSDPSLKPRVDAIGRGIVRYHRHPETIALQRNWNSALRIARGQWIHLLHDDDYVLPGFYAMLQSALKEAPPSVGAAFTAYENVNENGDVIFRNRVLGAQRGLVEDWVKVIGVSNVLNPPAVVVRRDAYERIGGFSEEILYTTDWELYMRLASFFDWWYEPTIGVHYRQHAQNVTAEQSAAGAQGEAFWRAIEMSGRYLPERVRDGVIGQSRRYHFRWALQRLRLPLQAGNPEGSRRLLREMLRIDNSEASIGELFDWLGTSLAEPLWADLADAIRRLSGTHAVPAFSSRGELASWLASDAASDVRLELAEMLVRQ